MHDWLLLCGHSTERVEKVPGPHDLRDHDHLVDELVCISYSLRVGGCIGPRVNLGRDRAIQRMSRGLALLTRAKWKLVGVQLLKKELQLRLDRHRRFFGLGVLVVFIWPAALGRHLLDGLRGLCQSFEELLRCRWRVVVFQTLDYFHCSIKSINLRKFCDLLIICWV